MQHDAAGRRDVERVQARGHRDAHRRRVIQEADREARALRAQQNRVATIRRELRQRNAARGGECQRDEAVPPQHRQRIVAVNGREMHAVFQHATRPGAAIRIGLDGETPVLPSVERTYIANEAVSDGEFWPDDLPPDD